MRNVARVLAASGFVQDAVRSNYRRSFRATKLVRSFLEASRLVKKINDEAASSHAASTRGALRAAHLGSAVHSSAEKRSVPLYIEATASHTRDEQECLLLNGRAFCSFAAGFLRKLRTCLRSACEEHSLTFEEVLLTENLQTRSSSLSVKKM